MIYRLILPDWATGTKVLEGEFTDEQIADYNAFGYNVYYLPNGPAVLPVGRPIEGSDIDHFDYIFVDFDLKSDKRYESKKAFIRELVLSPLKPSSIVDSGNGIHAYWAVNDLDALSYLRFQRRLIKHFDTDEAIAKIYQLMRVPNTINNKLQNDPKLCELISSIDNVYTAEQIDQWLPALTPEDEQYCQNHYQRTYKLSTKETVVYELPLKFAQLLKNNNEVSNIWQGGVDDRSKADYRLAHIMLASNFTRAEALSVLVNAPKALSRSPDHRVSYATNIVDKIWVETVENRQNLSSSVNDILNRPVSTVKGVRFQCYKWVDNTAHGFRLGHVMGLVAGSGVGKTVIALNLFLGFVESNPDYDHFFVSLEQTDDEIAERWKSVCGDNLELYKRVHIISNYNEDGSFRHLSLSEIKDYMVQFQKDSGRKIGCCVIDHIGVLRMKSKDGENQGIIDLCHQMKSFAIETGTFLIMQSQTSREKAGIGDLELNKDAAYGTSVFENYCDYLVTIWQPLKRCYAETGCPTVTAFKFCKIRHKLQKQDIIKEDICYKMYFDSNTGRLREMTQDEDKSFAFFLNKATNKRKQDRKTDLVEYTSVKGATNAATHNNSDARTTSLIT